MNTTPELAPIILDSDVVSLSVVRGIATSDTDSFDARGLPNPIESHFWLREDAADGLEAYRPVVSDPRLQSLDAPSVTPDNAATVSTEALVNEVFSTKLFVEQSPSVEITEQRILDDLLIELIEQRGIPIDAIYNHYRHHNEESYGLTEDGEQWAVEHALDRVFDDDDATKP